MTLLERGGWLIADDVVDVSRVRTNLIARCPAPIGGHLELHGLGISVLPALAAARVNLVVDLADPATIDRLPSPATTGILGILLPLIYIARHEFVRAGSYVSAAMARLVREVP
jgi:HPr kinase/phosphorylase